ncbi:MAG: hypothetical protein AAJB65_00030 [Candidatus Hodgkinia cicadicola]
MGCWLVRFSTCFGGKPHAEVAALSWLVRESASCVLVSLEPCLKFGKTPPCVYFILLFNVRLLLILRLDQTQRFGCVLLRAFINLGLIGKCVFVLRYGAKSVMTCFGQIGADSTLAICVNVSSCLRLRTDALGVSVSTQRQDNCVLLARAGILGYSGLRLISGGFRSLNLCISCNLIASSSSGLCVLARANTHKPLLLDAIKLHDIHLNQCVYELGCLMLRLTNNIINVTHFVNLFQISKGLFVYKSYSQLIKRLFWYNCVYLNV